MMVVAHATALNKCEFTYSPINSFLLISSSMKINTNGSTTPFSTCDQRTILTSCGPGIRHENPTGYDQQRVKPVKERRIAELHVNAGLEAQAFADCVGGRKRQDRGREERSVEQSDGEKNVGVLPG